MRLLLLLLGAGLVVLAFRVPVTAVADGGRTLEGFWVAALGVSICALGFGWVRNWRRAAALTAGLALSIAAQLTATKPSWLAAYKIEIWRLQEDSILVGAWGVVALQILAMARFFVKERAGFSEATRCLRRPLVVVGIAVFFVFAAAHATLAFDPQAGRLDLGAMTRTALQYAGAALLWATNLVHLSAIAVSLPAKELETARRRLSHDLCLPGSDLPPTGLDRALPWLAAGFALLSAALLNVFVLGRVPHVPDGIAYLWQAKCLATGALTAAAPPVPAGFEVYLFDTLDGRLFGVTNPGWPAVLAVGAFLGLEWLVNPVLGALAVLFTHAFLRRIADRGTANAVTLLLAASPWFLWLSASFMTHATTLALVAGGWFAVSTRRALGALAGGAAMGLVCTVRPLEGIALGSLTGLFVLGLGGRRLPLAQIPLYALGCVGGASLLLLYNSALAGDPFVFPIQSYLDRLWYPGANALGFGADVGNPPGWGPQDPLRGHGIWDVLYNTNQNVYHLNVDMLGWIGGSLVPFVVHVFRRRFNRTDRAALVFLFVLFVLYNLYWFSGGSDYGARYWYLMILPLLWITFRGIGSIGQLFEEQFPGATLRTAALAAISSALALALFMPWRAVAKYTDYRGYHPDFREHARAETSVAALFLVEVGSETEYGLAFLENDPTWSVEEPIFAWARDEETVEALLAAYPLRTVIRISGRSSETSAGRTVVTSRKAPGANRSD